MGDKKLGRVLVVDDDSDILELLEYNLSREGFKVKTVEESSEAIAVAENFSPDLIILDVMMPHPNGIELCRELRCQKRFENTYIFFLSAKSENYYHEAALDTGGDDYIEKIIGLRALTYKVISVLKRKFIIRKSIPALKIGHITVNRKTSSVTIGKHEIVLSKPEFELLFFFAQNPRKMISAASLLQNIWGSEIYLFDSSIDVYVQNLRHKLGLNLIHRVDGDAYKLDLR
jgi:two-component system alkaline phosphatase synthesis response regulator PhoP